MDKCYRIKVTLFPNQLVVCAIYRGPFTLDFIVEAQSLFCAQRQVSHFLYMKYKNYSVLHSEISSVKKLVNGQLED